MPHAPQSRDVFFNQPCPVCGRMLHVRVQLLGRRVYCQHCGGGFTALDAVLGHPAPADRVDELLARATRAIEQAACPGDDDFGLTG